MFKLLAFKSLAIIVVAASSSGLKAQNLTPAQKEFDFRFLVNLYNTQYAPVEWKKQLFSFDVLDIKPWLDRVSRTATDLDFYEVCVEYVASLNDTHDRFSLPSNFVANLNFTVDVYDGRLLIESINRTRLPVAAFPFLIGDELISIDDVDVQELLKGLAKYRPQGNPVATRRLTAALLTTRSQSSIPHAVDVGEAAKVVIQRQNGDLETYTIPWTKTGTPLEVGPVPSPKVSTSKRLDADAIGSPYADELSRLQWSGVSGPPEGVIGYGARNPVFLNGLGTGFTRRLGGAAADFFYSGTFKWEELTIGYIRIPNYSPPSQSVALQDFEREIAFMNQNTDGLVIDEMRNTGGLLCFGENIAARLIPYTFHATGFEVRATWSRLLGFYNSMIAAKASGAPENVITQYEIVYRELLAANSRNRGVTNPVPLCTSSLNRDPATGAYEKPLMMLIDEFSTSTADSVAGMIQDAGRGVLFGTRTNGAGGNNTSFDAGPYSEGVTGMTLALQVRQDFVGTREFAPTKYIENVGVRPDVESDYMTKDNLLQNGAPFVRDFLEHMAVYIRGTRTMSPTRIH